MSSTVLLTVPFAGSLLRWTATTEWAEWADALAQLLVAESEVDAALEAALKGPTCFYRKGMSG